MAEADSMADYLPTKYREVPLSALRFSARNKMSQYLNLTGRLPNENSSLTPDYNGLAELVGFDYLQQQNFALDGNPTIKLLNEWTQTPNLSPTVGKLVDHLVCLGRDDVLTDCKHIILRDIEHHLKARENQQTYGSPPIQDDTVTGSDITDHGVDEFRFITVADVNRGTPQMYDAFVSVCSETSNDYSFVTDILIPALEGPEHNLRLCVPWRDDLPGTSKYATDAHLINIRCKRVILILSPEFLASPICDFQLKFAHSLSPGARSKKVIPLCIEACSVPTLLNQVSMCNYKEERVTPWFWSRLAAVLKAPINNSITTTDVSLSDIKLNIAPPSCSVDYNTSSSSSSRTISTTTTTTSSSDRGSAILSRASATARRAAHNTVTARSTVHNTACLESRCGEENSEESIMIDLPK
ncbi:myeloid differentiation primary response protein MyD88-like [Gigantopelta aegis]|uniref:myeloid differentiation primary response protein MyD88-like n=1 Tax=Gigantopelta aegis TaxID=1735272 RepID=UPI001B88AA64|nr:myeloid differentiation primary response protein MyD88-like [Gigantopelta aegis]